MIPFCEPFAFNERKFLLMTYTRVNQFFKKLINGMILTSIFVSFAHNYGKSRKKRNSGHVYGRADQGGSPETLYP